MFCIWWFLITSIYPNCLNHTHYQTKHLSLNNNGLYKIAIWGFIHIWPRSFKAYGHNHAIMSYVEWAIYIRHHEKALHMDLKWHSLLTRKYQISSVHHGWELSCILSQSGIPFPGILLTQHSTHHGPAYSLYHGILKVSIYISY